MGRYGPGHEPVHEPADGPGRESIPGAGRRAFLR